MEKCEIRKKLIAYKWQLQQLRSLYCEDTITKNRQYIHIEMIKQKIRLLQMQLEDNVEIKEKGRKK